MTLPISLLYVDDIVLTGSSPTLLNNIVAHLRAEFAVKDMGELRFFLGIDIKRTSAGFFLFQERYADDILEHAGMTQCKPVSTPIDSKGKLSADGATIEDPASYRSLACVMMYLTITWPDLAFAVQQACLHMHDLKAPHLAMLKRILRYLRRTTSLGLHLQATNELSITAYSDADWAGCPDT
jgi:hypothetical protein